MVQGGLIPNFQNSHKYWSMVASFQIFQTFTTVCPAGKQAGGIGVSGSTVENDKAVAQVPLYIDAIDNR